MRQLTRAVFDTSWALALFGAQESVRLALAPTSPRAAEEAGHSLEAVARSAGQSLGPTLGEVFTAGDSLQRDALDVGWDAIPDPLAPATWFSSGAELAETAALTATRFVFPSAEAALAWRELGNKLEVYRLVKQVSRKLGVPGRDEPFDLLRLLERAYDLGEYPALWAVEGLGHDWLEHEWRGAEPPRGLLAGPAGRDLPSESLTMLHAGLGLGFAQRLLATLPGAAPEAEVRGVVARVTTLCRASSRPGYEGAALESLGLVTRSFHATRMGAVDAALRDADPEARDYFWHGVGRALYFLPINFVPCGRVTWRPFDMARREAPDEAARRNLLAGLGWAFALVNMRQPELLTRLLLAPHGAELAAGAGFADGVASTVMMRRDTTPDGRLLGDFLGHRPTGAGAGWWERLVRQPSEAALERIYPGLARRGCLGEIFRYHDFDELERLARDGGPRS